MDSPVRTTPEEPAPGIPGPELHRLDPRYVPYARLWGGLIAGAVLLAGGVALLAWALAAQPGFVRLASLGGLLAALVGGIGLVAWLHPPLELRHAGWRLSDSGLEVRTGVWFRRIVSVPRNRVQHTDVKLGPVERRYGLATLVVHTAGHMNSEVRVEGLPHATALRVRDRLLPDGPRAGAGDGS